MAALQSDSTVVPYRYVIMVCSSRLFRAVNGSPGDHPDRGPHSIPLQRSATCRVRHLGPQVFQHSPALSAAATVEKLQVCSWPGRSWNVSVHACVGGQSENEGFCLEHRAPKRFSSFLLFSFPVDLRFGWFFPVHPLWPTSTFIRLFIFLIFFVFYSLTRCAGAIFHH